MTPELKEQDAKVQPLSLLSALGYDSDISEDLAGWTALFCVVL